jgi:hypothetical protein
MSLQPNKSEIIKLNSDKSDNTRDIAGSITSGGLIGAGLSVAAQQLPPEWQTVVQPFIPTLSASISLIVISMIRKVRRKTQIKEWNKERQSIIDFCNVAIPISEKGLRDLRDERAKSILNDSISRFQQLKALAIGAVPYERPWLTDEVASAFPEPSTNNEIELGLNKLEESL